MAKLSPSTSPASQIAKQLPLDYSLCENDVYVGRGGLYRYHVGNMCFNDLILANLDRYYSASTRTEKTLLIYEIVDQVRANSPHGGFVKRDNNTGRWYEVGDAVAVSKSKHPVYKILF